MSAGQPFDEWLWNGVAGGPLLNLPPFVLSFSVFDTSITTALIAIFVPNFGPGHVAARPMEVLPCPEPNLRRRSVFS